MYVVLLGPGVGTAIFFYFLRNLELREMIKLVVGSLLLAAAACPTVAQVKWSATNCPGAKTPGKCTIKPPTATGNAIVVTLFFQHEPSNVEPQQAGWFVCKSAGNSSQRHLDSTILLGLSAHAVRRAEDALSRLL